VEWGELDAAVSGGAKALRKFDVLSAWLLAASAAVDVRSLRAGLQENSCSKFRSCNVGSQSACRGSKARIVEPSSRSRD
jgi:hypothetical protein